ncbi:MAG: hypothetical protein ACOVQE_08400 [Chitinophagaceae bacterium]
MYSIILIVALVLLAFVIAVQLIRFGSLVIKLSKDAELLKQKNEAETRWEFIKGLY